MRCYEHTGIGALPFDICFRTAEIIFVFEALGSRRLRLVEVERFCQWPKISGGRRETRRRESVELEDRVN